MSPARSTPAEPTSAERIGLGVCAAVEINSIAAVLQERFLEADAEMAFVLGLAIRLEDLSGAIIWALEGRAIDVEEARYRLFGPEAKRRGRCDKSHEDEGGVVR